MALLKVFVSSTCYDLGMVRGELRNFLINLGHEPVMSDYNDILFDPKDHTHESCIKEIPNSDVVILIIGSRFGGKAIPKATGSLDIDKLKLSSRNSKVLENPENISITQLEILKAIDSNIPIFTFVESRVMHDHLFYEKNKDKNIIDSIEFPSIEKKETAIYIFEFINFLRFRSKNNNITEFNKVSDIEDVLKKQWSALLQRLLYDQRYYKNEFKRIENFSEELKDIKSLVLSTISSAQAKEVGRAVLRYRRLLDFLLSFQSSSGPALLSSDIDWDTLLNSFDIQEVKVVNTSARYRPTVFLLKTDGSFYEYRNPVQVLGRFMNDWNSFRQLKEEIKTEVINVISESEQSAIPMLRYREQNFEEYVQEFEERPNPTSTTTTTSTTTVSKMTLSEQADNQIEDDNDYSTTVIVDEPPALDTRN